MPQDTPSRKLDQYIVRFPEGMRDRIKRLAEQNGRSMNSQIIQMLEFAMEETKMSANTYADADPLKEEATFLRDVISRNTRILERILSKVEDPDSDLAKALLEGREGKDKTQNGEPPAASS